MKPTGHTNLFNADCNVWMYQYRPQSAFYRPSGQPLTAEHIHKGVGILAASGVDTFLINPMEQVAYYPSKNVQTILDGYTRGDRSIFEYAISDDMTPEQIETYMAASTYLMDSYLDMTEAGFDWLKETVKACHTHGISPWLSVRMNDMHGGGNPDSYMNCELYKDPAMRLRGTTYNPTEPIQRGWQGFNYEKAEVRNHTQSMIEDATTNYDFEGLEIDWMRWPLCCEPGASQATIDTLTAWHGDLRTLTRQLSKKTGKPWPVGIKYVGTLDQMRNIGLDVQAMAQQDIIDFISPTNSWQTSWDIPCDELRKMMGPKVAVFGVVEIAPNWLQGYLPHQKTGNASLGAELPVSFRLSPGCPPILRGNAAAKHALGVDGIEVYNFPPADAPSLWPWVDEAFHADYPALRGLDDLEFLRGKPKFYTLSTQTGYYQHVLFESVAPFPVALGPGERRAARLPMIRESEDAGLEFIVQVVVQKKDKLPPVGVYLNGCWPNFDATPDERLLFAVDTMTHHIPDNIGLNFTFPLDAIREGWNEFVVMNGTAKDFWSDQSQDVVTIESLELAVR